MAKKAVDRTLLSFSAVPNSAADLLKLNLLISLLLMYFNILVTPWRKYGVCPAHSTKLFFVENLVVLSVVWCTLKSMRYFFKKLSDDFSISDEVTSASFFPICL